MLTEPINSRMVGNPYLIALRQSTLSSDHNRGLHPAESPVNTTRLLASCPDPVIEVSATGQKLTARLAVDTTGQEG